MLTRRALIAASASFTGALLARPAFAQEYPTRPVRIIVPYAAGGATDILARLLATALEGELRQSFVVDNRGGGASQVGTQAIAAAPADGHTIGLIDSAFTINPGLFAGKLPYDTRKDFAAVSLIATAPLVFVVHPSVPAASAQELVALAKQKPGMTYALPGLGTPVHLAGEQLRQVAGIDVVSVPYRGAGPSIADFIAGQVQMTFATVPSILEHVRAGRARALAMVGERSPLLPDVPTMAEAGLSRDRRGADVRHRGAGCDPCADRCVPERSGRAHHAVRSAARAAHRAWLCGDRLEPAGLPRAHRGRHRQMVAHHRGGQYQAGLGSGVATM